MPTDIGGGRSGAQGARRRREGGGWVASLSAHKISY